MKTLVAVLGLVALLCAVASAAPDSGAMLYNEQCSTCHGSHAQGSNIAPSLVGKSAADDHLMLDTGRMPAAEPYVNEIHKSPRLTQTEMTSVVNYVLSFSPHADRTMPVLGAGSVDRGHALFAENCAHCHGVAGDGASVGADNVAPSLMHATVYQVAEAIRAGPEMMPRFGPDVLSNRDVSDIARYVNALQTQAGGSKDTDAGGIALAHVGPVAEGFVAWFFGLGALVLFIRRIGSTS
jgi:ubiquinol-cytochrome c reductase cytochrome c subunit